MVRHVKTLLGVVLVLAVVSVSQAVSSEALTEADRQIYLDLFDATNAESQYQEMMNRLFYKFNNSLKQGLYHAAGNSDQVTQENSVEVELLLERILLRMSSVYRAEVNEIMPFKDLVENVYIPLYSKYFTNEEVKAITAFFKSPAGLKFALKGPSIMQQTAAEIEIRYEEKLLQASNKIQEEGLEELEKQLKLLKK